MSVTFQSHYYLSKTLVEVAAFHLCLMAYLCLYILFFPHLRRISWQ